MTSMTSPAFWADESLSSTKVFLSHPKLHSKSAKINLGDMNGLEMITRRISHMYSRAPFSLSSGQEKWNSGIPGQTHQQKVSLLQLARASQLTLILIHKFWRQQQGDPPTLAVHWWVRLCSSTPFASLNSSGHRTSAGQITCHQHCSPLGASCLQVVPKILALLLLLLPNPDQLMIKFWCLA